MGDLNLGILNVLSIYLVLGIGVDDLFVLVDAFKQEEERELRRSGGREGRRTSADASTTAAASATAPAPLDSLLRLRRSLGRSYHRAASSMLLTSFTTCMSFVCNLGTAIPVIQSFMLFMSLLIITNYIMVITTYVIKLSLYSQ